MPFDATGTEQLSVCPACNETFNRKRSNQKFCSPKCRKNNYQLRDRKENPKNAQNSPDVKRTNMQQRERASYLAELFYSKPPSERLGFVKELVDAARNGDASLKSILTDPRLLRASPDEKRMFHRKAPQSYRTISQAANAYCKQFWGASVGPVVRGEVPEPPTGEVME